MTSSVTRQSRPVWTTGGPSVTINVDVPEVEVTVLVGTLERGTGRTGPGCTWTKRKVGEPPVTDVTGRPTVRLSRTLKRPHRTSPTVEIPPHQVGDVT